MSDNFIFCNEKSLSKEQCDEIILFFENNKKYHDLGSTSGGIDDKVKKCTEIFLSTDELKKPFFRNLFYALGDTKEKFVNKYNFLNNTFFYIYSPLEFIYSSISFFIKTILLGDIFTFEGKSPFLI